MIMIAAARQKWSQEPGGKQASKRDKDARAICLCKALTTRDPGVPVPCPGRGTGSRTHFCPGLPLCLGIPSSLAARGATGRAEEGGGGVLM